ncbi:hypothetical protein [Hymenobacter sp. CRA2]|uniref:hypothetical protein n=1 Tax=Hymenobacter sp. CRA2 TaxID=1955620 RepID=UPI00098EC99C|nr:hypothetical protein [Hymenobacter sp. CRA2]OON65645.1 hypothetical protein B0919_23495 [Hymenobacter sp. CRA2]
MTYRFFGFVLPALLLGLTPPAAYAQTQPTTKAARPVTKPARKPAAKSAASAASPASFYTTYAYRSYSIYSPDEAEPTPANGVGGTLTLNADGSYQKRLRLAGPSGPMSFNQDGQFTLSGDQISFTYPGPNGQPKTDQGSFRLDPKQQLVLTIEGFPAGSRGVYTLEAQQPAAGAK